MFPQLPGEHVGIGEPPSASDAVDSAKVNSIAATNKRTTFFMRSLLVAANERQVLERQATCFPLIESQVFENRAILR
jgi:hypothetical protein